MDFGRPRGGRDLDRIAEESRALVHGSAAHLGHGYTVETELVGTMFGEQRFPCRVYFPDAANYLRFVGKESEFAVIQREIAIIEHLAPLAGLWARQHPFEVLSKADLWGDICVIIDHLLHHPRPGCYPRELPLHVSGKLLGEEQRTICAILAGIPGAHWQAGADYYEQLGLRRPPASFVRFRFLDASVRELNGYPTDDVSVSLDTLRVRPLLADRIFLVENSMTYLAFPPVSGAIVMFGEGNAVARVGDLHWLSERRVTYWGDLDPFGFLILDRLRARFPDVRSMLMHRPLLLKYRRLAAEGKRPGDFAPVWLTADERSVAQEVFDQQISIEQEKIPQSEVAVALAAEAL